MLLGRVGGGVGVVRMLSPSSTPRRGGGVLREPLVSYFLADICLGSSLAVCAVSICVPGGKRHWRERRQGCKKGGNGAQSLHGLVWQDA